MKREAQRQLLLLLLFCKFFNAEVSKAQDLYPHSKDIFCETTHQKWKRTGSREWNSDNNIVIHIHSEKDTDLVPSIEFWKSENAPEAHAILQYSKPGAEIFVTPSFRRSVNPWRIRTGYTRLSLTRTLHNLLLSFTNESGLNSSLFKSLYERNSTISAKYFKQTTFPFETYSPYRIHFLHRSFEGWAIDRLLSRAQGDVVEAPYATREYRYYETSISEGPYFPIFEGRIRSAEVSYEWFVAHEKEIFYWNDKTIEKNRNISTQELRLAKLQAINEFFKKCAY